jgi:hypothetical protein
MYGNALEPLALEGNAAQERSIVANNVGRIFISDQSRPGRDGGKHVFFDHYRRGRTVFSRTALDEKGRGGTNKA